MHAIIALNNVGTGFTPTLYSAHNNAHNKPVRAGFTPTLYSALYSAHNSAQNNDEIYGQSPNGQSQRFPLHITDNDNRATAMVAHTIGDIIGAYKSLVANECLRIWKTKWVGAKPAPKMGKLWQTNYHEHIIRNQQSYQKISEYIVNNPAKWLENKFYK